MHNIILLCYTRADAVSFASSESASASDFVHQVAVCGGAVKAAAAAAAEFDTDAARGNGKRRQRFSISDLRAPAADVSAARTVPRWVDPPPGLGLVRAGVPPARRLKP